MLVRRAMLAAQTSASLQRRPTPSSRCGSSSFTSSARAASVTRTCPGSRSGHSRPECAWTTSESPLRGALSYGVSSSPDISRDQRCRYGSSPHLWGPIPRWVPRLGALAPGKWVNFPAGALYASPQSADGTFVADASLGEYFGAREGLLLRKPVYLQARSGARRERGSAHAPALEAEIRQMLAFGANSERVGSSRSA